MKRIYMFRTGLHGLRRNQKAGYSVLQYPIQFDRLDTVSFEKSPDIVGKIYSLGNEDNSSLNCAVMSLEALKQKLLKCSFIRCLGQF
ncbi:hypothetical protein CQ054_20985 [Ochrobactrum sp. MYb29]|nr:hypothetical protein CQ054_20985 [Ochrobactrum sp. MYb29]